MWEGRGVRRGFWQNGRDKGAPTRIFGSMGIVLVISDEEVEVWFTSVAENPFLVTMIAQPPIMEVME